MTEVYRLVAALESGLVEPRIGCEEDVFIGEFVEYCGIGQPQPRKLGLLYRPAAFNIPLLQSADEPAKRPGYMSSGGLGDLAHEIGSLSQRVRRDNDARRLGYEPQEKIEICFIVRLQAFVLAEISTRAAPGD